MSLEGHVRNGVIELEEGIHLPEGTTVRVEVTQSVTTKGNGLASPRRQGGQYAGKIWIAPDFDVWPEEIQESWGMKQ